MYMSGSGDLPMGALLFFEDGSMTLSAADCEEEDKSSLLLVVDFFSYALSRDDWMGHYTEQVRKDHANFLSEKEPKLRVIQGGITGSVAI